MIAHYCRSTSWRGTRFCTHFHWESQSETTTAQTKLVMRVTLEHCMWNKNGPLSEPSTSTSHSHTSSSPDYSNLKSFSWTQVIKRWIWKPALHKRLSQSYLWTLVKLHRCAQSSPDVMYRSESNKLSSCPSWPWIISFLMSRQSAPDWRAMRASSTVLTPTMLMHPKGSWPRRPCARSAPKPGMATEIPTCKCRTRQDQTHSYL